VSARFLAIVNPAAGGGRCGTLAEPTLDRLRHAGIELEVASTSRAGDATQLAREAHERGFRSFLAVGGDGTAYEIVNGLFPQSDPGDRATLGFLPLGTGNSFLNDFSSRGLEQTIEALARGSRRAVDVLRLEHAEGELYFINLLSLGFPADVGETVNRRFKRLGELGYVLGVLARLAGLNHPVVPHRLCPPVDAKAAGEWDRRPCLFLAFSNSKFTGGKMMIAPKAEAGDGKIEYVRWGPIGRLGLLWNLPRLFTGTHIEHPLASRAAATKIELALDAPATVMIDGEILRLQCRSVEVLPGALDVIV
jgi:diacylglycerol kinase (ATP)